MSGIFIEGQWYDNTGKVCRRCKAPVWESSTPGYKYQCLKCDEDLFEFETEEKVCGYPAKVIVARNINGATPNTVLEYVLDLDGDEVIFESQAEAEDFLLNGGFRKEEFEHLYFIEFENMQDAEQMLFKNGDCVKVFGDYPITGNGVIVGDADDEYENFPDIEEGAYDSCFIVDFGEQGTCTVHASDMFHRRKDRTKEQV